MRDLHDTIIVYGSMKDKVLELAQKHVDERYEFSGGLVSEINADDGTIRFKQELVLKSRDQPIPPQGFQRG